MELTYSITKSAYKFRKIDRFLQIVPSLMVNTNVITMQNTILFKRFSCSCKRTTLSLFHHVFLGILK